MQAPDVGRGGLAEEFASIGFRVTGIDPSERSLATAKQHAQSMGLSIQYQREPENPSRLPATPTLLCTVCDVLHVRGLSRVIGEIYRVTKPAGVFLFDTLNRTFISKLVAIKIWQEWKSMAFMPPRLHEWRRFIRPEELKGLLVQAGFWLLYLESDTKSAAGGESSESFWLMRKPTAGGAPGKVLRVTAADDFHCAWKPAATSACILSHVLDQAEGRQIVFYALDPVRGKGNQLAKLPFSPSQLHNRWGLSPDASHLALLNQDKQGVRILVIAVAYGGTDILGARGTPPACRRPLEERKARPHLAASLHPACASRKPKRAG